LTELFLKSDPPDLRELARMQNYIRERIAGPALRIGASKIDRMIATSSTAAAVVCAVNRVRRSKRDHADRLAATGPQIRRLYREVTGMSLADRRGIVGIGPRRAEIIVAGVAVLHEFIENFRLPRLYYSTAGVREGIIADLANRQVGLAQARLDPDRRRVVQAVSRRYGISSPHTRKVAWLAVRIFERLGSLHGLPPVHGQLLEAAAYLYNIGHFVNESRHHKHSLYLVTNTDLAGFSEWERAVIANLCRYHRKSMPQPAHLEFQALDAEGRRAVVLLAPLLRIALALDQSQDQRVEDLHVTTQDRTVEIYIRSSKDLDVEEWHAAQVGPVFRESYGLPLVIRVEK
jgi:exopolyphosphatase/guanosine-5'-triphosphate,3'-diphosphate pyrophosphatase